MPTVTQLRKLKYFAIAIAPIRIHRGFLADTMTRGIRPTCLHARPRVTRRISRMVHEFAKLAPLESGRDCTREKGSKILAKRGGGVEGDEEETLETMFLAGRYICRIPTSRDA